MTGAFSRTVTVEGRTVQDAIVKGLGILGVSRSRVAIRILSEENKGLFGMRGAKPARVRLTLKTDRKEAEGS